MQSRRGFVLLPVIIAMSLIAAIAFLLNRDNSINANMASVQSDTDKARYAAEAGLQAVNAKVQSLSCGGGFPVVGNPLSNNNFGGASYVAYANSAGGNTTSLTSTGTYNGTSITLQRNNVYVYQSTIKTYTLQPDEINGIDTYLKDSEEKNFGDNNKLEIEENRKNILIKFNLSAFPSGSRPVSASFRIRQTDGVGASLNLYRVTKDWVEGTGASSPLDGATWDTRNGTTAWATSGGDLHPNQLNNTPVVSIVTGWANFDVTAITTAWLSGTYQNYGMMVKSDGDIGSVKFSSSDHSTTSNRPKIIFQYMLPCGATGPQDPTGGSVTLNPVADSYNGSSAAEMILTNGANTSLALSNSGSSAKRILMRFDTSTVPAGSTIQNATLRLYVRNITSATSYTKALWANAVDESWAEGVDVNRGKSCPTTMVTGTTWEARDFCIYWNSNLHPPNTPQSWSTLASMPTPRTNHMVATVNNKIYVIGGLTLPNTYYNKVEEYDPATNTWATKANMPTARSDAAVAVVNGKIYVIGGTKNLTTPLGTNEVYDPATNTWATKAAITTPRMDMGTAVVNDKIYVIGGKKNTNPSGLLNNNEVYDPTTNTWSNKAAMPTSRAYLSVQAVNGKIYSIGGYNGTNSLNVNESYDVTANTWSTKLSMPSAADSMASAVIGNKAYLIGGMQSSAPSNRVLMYDTINNVYQSQTNYPIPVDVAAAVSLNGYIYSIGGDDGVSVVYPNHYKFDTGMPAPIATAAEESSNTSPLPSGFTNGWITFDIKTLVQEWVDSVRPNNGLVIHTEVPDQFSINSRENSSNKPQLIVEY